jgi:hypothetical protein
MKKVLLFPMCYNPTLNTWSPMPTTGSPSTRQDFSLTWTGSEMILIGGMRADYSTGPEIDRYLPDAFAWTPSRVMYLYLRP